MQNIPSNTSSLGKCRDRKLGEMSSLSMSYNITNSYFYPLDGLRTIFYFVKNFATAAGLTCPSKMAHQCLAPNAPFPLSKSFYECGKSTERYDLSVGADLRKGRESIYSKWRFGSRRYLKESTHAKGGGGNDLFCS